MSESRKSDLISAGLTLLTIVLSIGIDAASAGRLGTYSVAIGGALTFALNLIRKRAAPAIPTSVGALITMMMIGGAAQARCPGERCPAPQFAAPSLVPQPVGRIAPAPFGAPPGPGFRWASLPGVGPGWVHSSVAAPAIAPTCPGGGSCPARK